MQKQLTATFHTFCEKKKTKLVNEQKSKMRRKRSIYIVEISCQLLDVLLQLIRCLQAVLEETGEKRLDVNFTA